MADKKYRVLVYGTLVKNGRNNKAYMPDDAVLIHKQAITKNALYSMKQFESETTKGAYTPGVRSGGKYRIEGEVWEVSAVGLLSLHGLEDYDSKRDKSENNYNFEQVKLDNSELVHIYIINSNREAVEESRGLIHFDKEKNSQSWHEYKILT